jgi:hypothetical protein
LFELLHNHGLKDNHIKKAYINIEFNIEPIKFDLDLIQERGNPLICEVILIDYKNKKYKFQQRDRCKEYDKGNFIQNIHNKPEETDKLPKRVFKQFLASILKVSGKLV